MKMFYGLVFLGFIVATIIVLQLGCPLQNPDLETLANANVQSDRLVDISNVIPSIQRDIRYYTAYNFVGERIDGYDNPKCLLTKQAAEALAKVQAEMIQNSYTLKVYDCYRPQSAVDRFWRWAQDTTDTRMKSIFYPNINKKDLFKLGYIARRSSHSRGSTVDLTIVSASAPPQEIYVPNRPFVDNSIDMGSAFDLFDPISNTESTKITQAQLNNRLLLKKAMLKHGFKDYSLEWWHFTLKNEPFPETYFNFPIE